MTTAFAPPPHEEAAGQMRVIIGAAAGVACILGAAGLTAPLLFTDPDPLKYGATVVGPLMVTTACASRNPLRTLVLAAIVVAPFAGLVASFGGTEFSVLIPFLLLAGLVALTSGARPPAMSSVGVAAAAAAALLLAPVLDGEWGTYVLLLGIAGGMGYLVARVASEPGGLRAAMGALVAGASIQAAIALWEFQTGNQFNAYSESAATVFGRNYFFGFEDLNRPSAALFDPISLGNVLALSLPVAIVLAVTARSGLARGGATLASVVIAAGLAVTFSRMSWIGAIVGIVVMLALLPPGVRARAISSTAVFAVVVGGFLVTTAGSEIGTRFSSITDPTSSANKTADGDKERLALWAGATQTAEDNPVAGVGFGELPAALAARRVVAGPGVHAHSTYLQLLAEAGFVGILALALIVIAVLRGVWKGLQANRMLFAGIAGGVAAVLVVWLTDYVVRYSAVAATMAVLAGMAAAQVRADPTSESP